MDTKPPKNPYNLPLKNNSTIFMHNATMDLANYPYKLEAVTTLTSKEVPQMVDAVDFKISGDYWYFAKGRTIYQFSLSGLDISTYLTLPDDGSGDIVTWNINAASDYTKMGIATYNSSANTTFKGSYYLYDMVSSSYDSKELNVIDKAVKIQIGL